MFEVAEGDGEQGGEEAAVDSAEQVTMALTGPCDIGCAFEILEVVTVDSGTVDSVFGQWILHMDIFRTPRV